MARAAVRRLASSTSEHVIRSRSDKRQRHLLSIACEDDAALVSRFTSFAKQSLGHAARSDELFEPLAELCLRSARGELPRSEWQGELGALQYRYQSSSPNRRWRSLRSSLQQRIPTGARELRLREVLLQSVVAAGSSNIAPDANASLSIIMEAAIECDATHLQHELLGHFRELASATDSGGLGLCVQEPLLRHLGAPEATHEASSNLSTDIDLLCKAAALARNPKDPMGSSLEASQSSNGVTTIAAGRHAPSSHAHGCLLVDDESGAVLGAGYNHYVRSAADDDAVALRRIVHAEAHAVADAIRRHGEVAAFRAFPRATAWTVELLGRVGYDDAHPCPKCEGILRAVGVRAVSYTNGLGGITHRALGPPLPHLLGDVSVCAPLAIILREEFDGVPCGFLGREVVGCTLQDLRSTTKHY